MKSALFLLGTIAAALWRAGKSHPYRRRCSKPACVRRFGKPAQRIIPVLRYYGRPWFARTTHWVAVASFELRTLHDAAGSALTERTSNRYAAAGLARLPVLTTL